MLKKRSGKMGDSKIINGYAETHLQGHISIEQPLKAGLIKGDFGVQIAEDGRVWICIDGIAAIRFKPFSEYDLK
jgi:hypothetical protein